MLLGHLEAIGGFSFMSDVNEERSPLQGDDEIVPLLLDEFRALEEIDTSRTKRRRRKPEATPPLPLRRSR
jgi:hypothetical protein